MTTNRASCEESENDGAWPGVPSKLLQSQGTSHDVGLRLLKTVYGMVGFSAVLDPEILRQNTIGWSSDVDVSSTASLLAYRGLSVMACVADMIFCRRVARHRLFSLQTPISDGRAPTHGL
jgi:hypothetical protein